MTFNGRRAVPIIIGIAIMGSIAVAQQVKRTVNAVIEAPSLEYDMDIGVAVFSGGTKVVLKGAFDATLKAATVTAKLAGKPQRVESVVADGSVVLGMKTAEYDATMSAPNMTVKLTGGPDRVESVIANGPVGFTAVTTPADKQSPARKLVATAKEQATYANDTKLVKLIGGATADVTPLEEGTDGETIHFTGQTITYNLKTRKLNVDNANLTVETNVD